jgi:hypothetical protein
MHPQNTQYIGLLPSPSVRDSTHISFLSLPPAAKKHCYEHLFCVWTAKGWDWILQALGVICLVARRWVSGSNNVFAYGYSQLMFGFDMAPTCGELLLILAWQIQMPSYNSAVCMYCNHIYSLL